MDGWQPQADAALATESATQCRLTVLLPTFNEERAIQFVLDDIVHAVSPVYGLSY